MKSQLKYTSENKKREWKLVGYIYAVGIHSNCMRKLNHCLVKTNTLRLFYYPNSYYIWLSSINVCIFIVCALANCQQRTEYQTLSGEEDHVLCLGHVLQNWEIHLSIKILKYFKDDYKERSSTVHVHISMTSKDTESSTNKEQQMQNNSAHYFLFKICFRYKRNVINERRCIRFTRF